MNSSDENAHCSESCTIDLAGLNKTPLYGGTNLTITVAICLVMQFALSNNLPDEAINNLLKLLHLILPSSKELI